MSGAVWRLRVRFAALTAALPTSPLQDRAPCDSLLDAVRQIKPTVLIGLSDDAPPHAFDREVQPGGGAGWRLAGQRRKLGAACSHTCCGLNAPTCCRPLLLALPPNPATPCLQVCEALAAGCERPLILPLSRKSPDGRLEASEVAPADALAWTQVGL